MEGVKARLLLSVVLKEEGEEEGREGKGRDGMGSGGSLPGC